MPLASCSDRADDDGDEAWRDRLCISDLGVVDCEVVSIEQDLAASELRVVYAVVDVGLGQLVQFGPLPVPGLVPDFACAEEQPPRMEIAPADLRGFDAQDDQIWAGVAIDQPEPDQVQDLVTLFAEPT